MTSNERPTSPMPLWRFGTTVRTVGIISGVAIALILLFGSVRTIPIYRAVDVGEPAGTLLPQRKPSAIVIYVIDALRPDHLGVYGYGRDTAPEITKLARDGAVFTHCFSNTTWTLESVRGLFVGMPGAMYSRSRHSCATPDFIDLLPEYFEKAGWTTGLVTENVHVTETYGLAQGFDYVGDSSEYLGTSENIADNVLKMADATEGSLRSFVRQNREHHFFLYVHTMETHGPLVIPESIETFYPAGSTPQENLVDWYDTAVRWADQRLGTFVELLKDEGIFENTLLIVTADHGESLVPGKASGTHRGPPLFERVHIPLIVSWPNRIDSKSVFSQNVQFMDIGPTVLEAVGIPRAKQFQAHSLVHLLTQGLDESLAGRPIFTVGQYMNGWGVLQDDSYLYSVKGSRRLINVNENSTVDDQTGGNEAVVRELSGIANDYFSAQRRHYVDFESSRNRSLLGSLGSAFGWGSTGSEAEKAPELSKEQVRALKALGYLD